MNEGWGELLHMDETESNVRWQWKWGFPLTVRWGLNRTAHDKSNDLLSKWNIWCRLHNLHTHDLRHHKVMAVIYLPASFTRLLPTGSCPQHHSEVELQSSYKTDRVINLMFPVFVVKREQCPQWYSYIWRRTDVLQNVWIKDKLWHHHPGKQNLKCPLDVDISWLL